MALHRPPSLEALPDTSSSEVAPVWLQRLSLIVLVLFCLYIGGLMVVFPWWPNYWNHNSFLTPHPAARAFFNHGWVRGVVSGIGILDIWIGISELLHYRDYRS